MPRFVLISGILCVALILGACRDDSESQQADVAAEQPSTSQQQSNRIRTPNPEPIPDLTLQTMGGESIALAKQEGKVLLVNFWATWCAPCRKEIPDLKALQSEFGSENLTIVGVALDEEGAEVVKPFVDEYSINYPIVIDKEGITEAALGPVPGLPTTLIVNPRGQIVRRVLGIFPTDKMKPTLQEMITSSDQQSETT